MLPLEELQEMAGRGWRLLPVDRESKRPLLGDNWQAEASADAATVEAWFTGPHVDAGVGVLLGPASEIIDLECDSAEAEACLYELFDGNPPICPTFKSTRGKHRIFSAFGLLGRQDVANTAVVKGKKGSPWEGVELRLGVGKAAQSVFPPTPGRTWLVHPSEVEAPRLPSSVLNKLLGSKGGKGYTAPKGPRSNKEWDEIFAEGATEGGRNETAAAVIGKTLSLLGEQIHNAAACNLQWRFIQAWNLTNKPPLDDDELKGVFRKILQRAREQKANEDWAVSYEAATALEVNAPDDRPPDSPPGWRLVIRSTDPATYKLWGPPWKNHGYLLLDTSQLMRGEAIRMQAMEQAKVFLRPDFVKAWEGWGSKIGIANMLVDVAEHEEAPAEENREMVVAELVLVALSRARAPKENEKITGNTPIEVDGEIIFSFSQLYERLAGPPHKVTRPELSRVISSLGGGVTQKYRTESRGKLWSVPTQKLEELSEMLHKTSSQIG